MDKLNWSDNPEYLEALLAGYALGDLSPEEMDQVQSYLEQNPASADELTKLQTTLALLPLSLPEAPPSPDLKSRILAAAARSDMPPAVIPTTNDASRSTPNSTVELPSLQPPAPGAPAAQAAPAAPAAPGKNNVISLSEQRRRPRTQRSTWMVGSIAAGLLAVLGFQNYKLTQDMAELKQAVVAQQSQQNNYQTQLVKYQETIAMLRQPNNRLMAMKGMEDKSSGSLVIVPKDQKAVLTLQNVPPLPQGQMYRLWAMVKGKKVYCSEFKPTADGSVFVNIPLDDLGDAKSVAVTIDPQTADKAKPVGDMVMEGAISI
ncbi:anti-sigma factor [filamentous cyanobacterium LEGE 11480]|uniref:Regulator of SigK n=1 Tax=Romeriopsis navalis LEGE 11480 TaxID=2777977 RepID=A0A928VQ58_9CYAN|nr:anti-sigma factor [Romeriopsis navalis]MBE9030881.1 anti-sigma factor [Romeriopsis navalis LEGE 11480]